MGSDLGPKYHGRMFTNLNVYLLAVILGLCVYIVKTHVKSIGGGGCVVSFGAYKGPVYNSRDSGTRGEPKCLVESKFVKVQQHHVQMPGSDSIIPDWLWIDYHDRINVLVEAEATKGQTERKFLIFEQSKYALEGRMSKAIIGGIIEPGEKPEHTAKREVEEEIGLTCNQLHFLGRFRTDVNRGMGWLNSFLATDCVKAQKHSEDDLTKAEEVGAADTERQDLRTITLPELRKAAMDGDFLEVQWSATVALALLHPELMDQ